MNEFSEEQVRTAFDGAKSIADFSRKLGLKINNGSGTLAHKIAAEFDLDCEDIKFSNIGLQVSNDRRKISDEEWFVAGVKRHGQATRSRMVRLGVKDECSECKIGPMWNGKELVLQLDHIDGDNLNNVFENLQILCPNCHTQTETYANKNPNRYSYCDCGSRIGKRSTKCKPCYQSSVSLPVKQQEIDFPPLEEILDSVRNLGWSATSRNFNIIDNTLRKFVKRNGVDPKEIKKVTKAELKLLTI